MPSYQLTHSDKLYRAVCTVRARKYASLWEKNKKFAEQGAALTCVKFLHIKAPAKPDRGGEDGSEVAESGYTARAESVPTEAADAPVSAATEKVPGSSSAQPEPTNTEPPTDVKAGANGITSHTNGDSCGVEAAGGSAAVTGGAGDAVTGGAGDAGQGAADEGARVPAGVSADADLCCTVER